MGGGQNLSQRISGRSNYPLTVHALVVRGQRQCVQSCMYLLPTVMSGLGGGRKGQ